MLPRRKEIENLFQLPCFYFSLSECSCSNFLHCHCYNFSTTFFLSFFCVTGSALVCPVETDCGCVKKSPDTWKVSDLDIIVDPILSPPTSLQSAVHNVIRLAPTLFDTQHCESVEDLWLAKNSVFNMVI